MNTTWWESDVGFLKYVTRTAYSDQRELAGISDEVSFQRWLVAWSALQLTLPLGMLAGFGFLVSFKRLTWHLSIGLVLLYLGGTSILNLMLGFEFNRRTVAVFEPYPVISYLALVVWLGVAVKSRAGCTGELETGRWSL